MLCVWKSWKDATMLSLLASLKERSDLTCKQLEQADVLQIQGLRMS